MEINTNLANKLKSIAKSQRKKMKQRFGDEAKYRAKKFRESRQYEPDLAVAAARTQPIVDVERETIRSRRERGEREIR